ncbi:MAG: pseudouridine synthase [Bacteroidota bacterium]|nr:pseudouridine synthase [Bacteroidota bacterium]
MATEFNSTGSGKFNSRNKFTRKSSNDSDNSSRSKGKPAKFNNEGKKIFNRSTRFDRNNPNAGENRENNQKQEFGNSRENKRFGGFQSSNKFKKTGPFTSRAPFSKEGDVAPKGSQRFDDNDGNRREDDYRPARPYNSNRNFNTENRYRKSPFGDVPKGKPGERNRSFKAEKEAYRQKLQAEGNRPYYSRSEEDRPASSFKRHNRDASYNDRPSFDRNRNNDRKPFDHNREESGRGRRSFHSDRETDKPENSSFRNFRERDQSYRRDSERKPFNKRSADNGKQKSFRRGGEEQVNEAPDYDLRRYSNRESDRNKEGNRTDGGIRLNRYIANAGVCSRREADALIAAGEIKVNGEVVTEMGYVVKPEDTVQYGKKRLNREKMVYVLLNKPKDFITTTDDPEGRKTVMNLVANASKERIFPVGRLDRNTTGLLLFTNDGELAQKLTHPSHQNSKIYQVELDKPITKEDFEKIEAGLELEDGKAEVDELALLGDTGKFLGIKIHIGKNRIVRRIFEHLGYEVVSLDRVQYAGLTKKDLPRGKWRFLTEKEVIRLKYFL